MATFKECTFTRQSVQLDGMHYERCTFEDCVIAYGGGIPPTLINNNFKDCSWQFVGAAQNTLQFMNAIYNAGGRELIETILAEIRKPAQKANHE